MAKSASQKLKLLYIIKILNEKSDELHPISTMQLIEELAYFDIKAERKSIYDDMNQLTDFGYDIIVNHSKQNGGYYLASREFELAELKLLVDAVQASKFITLKKSKELISKLEALTSIYNAKQLQRQVYVANRIKTVNESIYYNVDYIHKAIQSNCQIQFKYFEWNIDKQMRFKKEGNRYSISPWALTFNDENYYMIGYDDYADMIKHYRVDKMTDMQIIADKRLGVERFKQFDIAAYSNKTFGMFGGTEEMVTLQFYNRFAGVVLDRFGKDVDIRKRDEEHFSVRVKVAVSGQFFGWITGLGTGAEIIAPEEVQKYYLAYMKELVRQYR